MCTKVYINVNTQIYIIPTCQPTFDDNTRSIYSKIL